MSTFDELGFDKLTFDELTQHPLVMECNPPAVDDVHVAGLFVAHPLVREVLPGQLDGVPLAEEVPLANPLLRKFATWQKRRNKT